MADAEIVVGADASGLERALAVGLQGVKNFAKEAKDAVGGAVSSLVTGLADVALQQGKVNFGSMHQQVRDFEASTARMAVASGRDLSAVRGEADAVGVAIGKRPGEVVQWASEVGKLTYNFGGAIQGLKGIAELSAATGRNVTEYRGLAAELSLVGRVSGDTSQMIGLLKTQADSLGVVGGVAAFADQVQGLQEAFSHFAVKGPEQFGQMTELAGKLGAGLNPMAAQRVQGQVFGSLTNNSFEWSRFLGRDIYDKNGQLEDPNKTVGDIVSKIEKTYKGDARRMLMIQFGPEAGSRLHNLAQSGELFKSVAPKPAGAAAGPEPADALKRLLGTDAGQRDVAAAQLQVSSQNLLGSSTKLGAAADALQRFAASHPVASTFASTVAGGLLGGGLSAAGKTLAQTALLGGLKTTGLGLLAGAGGTIAAAGAAGVAGFAGTYALGKHFYMDPMLEAERQKKMDPELAHQLDVDKQVRDRVRGARGWAAIPGGLAPSAQDNALARGAGTAEGQQALQAQLRGEGISAEDAKKIGEAMATALARQLQVNVQSSPDNPLSATVRSSQSSAAGNQGGT